MGIVGRYIDALSDEQRDRIVEAKGWTSAFVDDDCRCLVGHAEDYWYDYDICDTFAKDPALVIQGEHSPGDWDAPCYLFPHLCDRFGQDRIVRACKQRAAKGNQPTVREIRDEIFQERKDHAERMAFMYGSTLL